MNVQASGAVDNRFHDYLRGLWQSQRRKSKTETAPRAGHQWAATLGDTWNAARINLACGIHHLVNTDLLRLPVHSLPPSQSLRAFSSSGDGLLAPANLVRESARLEAT